MTKVYVSSSYRACVDSQVDLPEGKNWEDVADWYVKWDVLWLKFKGNDEYTEIALDSDTTESIDWKRPSSTEILAVDEDGCTDFDQILAEN